MRKKVYSVTNLLPLNLDNYIRIVPCGPIDFYLYKYSEYCNDSA